MCDVFIVILYYRAKSFFKSFPFFFSQAGLREDIHANAKGAQYAVQQGHQMVRLSVDDTKSSDEGEVRGVSSGQTEGRDRHPRAPGHAQEGGDLPEHRAGDSSGSWCSG
ncbi:hypothetical protein CEXT_671751 [Caerostris extrusa]|uniref:Uncharacterized protein n=1 Tax=Caerostris extrusa TaxID=172846 RepID=A0AAV4XAP1_CAEEX|nr:hypothetical protein CEXT_671751 [Caerostris extrusa]